jgi:hypothetical protein
MRKILPILALGIVAIGPSCVISMEQGSAPVRKVAGDELVDLKRALDVGALTQEEYDLAKATLVASPKKK